ncbi:MAG: phosphoribosyltransferase family protein [Pseudomonadota bacterium]
MDKLFITADDLLRDSFELAAKIYDSGFRPSFIVGIWRGGAPVGIAIQEFLHVLGCDSDHIAIRTSAYHSGIDRQRKAVQVHNLGYLLENLGADDRLLLVDDVFDTGRSLQAVLDELDDRLPIPPAGIKIACPWYKPNRNQTQRAPDFCLHETDQWLVFPHEITGLSYEEINRKNPELAALLAQRNTSE